MRIAVVSAVVVAVLAAPAAAHADGELTMRGVWYKEKATRVIQPMLDARFDVGETAEIDVHTLVDSITSASVASGAAAQPFSERRYELGGGYRQLFGALRLGGTGRVSHEPDYDSIFGGLGAELELFDKNMVIGINGSLGRDAVSNAATQGGPMAGVAITGTLTTALGSVSVSQLLSRNRVVGLTYDISYLRGFLENPYRTAITGDGLVPERHPDDRLRHAVASSVRQFVERTGTTVVGSYRFYRDDWDVTGHTPELRLIQEAGDGVDFTVRYRYHWQSRADFFRPSYPSNDLTEFPYVTDDVKLSHFTSHTLGVKLGVAGHVLGLEGRLEEARGEVVLEYTDQNNRFGNAAIAHVALTLPFEY